MKLLLLLPLLLPTMARAVECPTPAEPCKVLILTPTEEKLLMQQNGILDTAAQARALDLGQFSVYLKTRIANAPQGEIRPLPKPSPAIPTPPTENKSPEPVDSPAK